MENPVEPKKSNTGMIIGIGAAVVLLLLCCCAIVIIIAGLTMFGPAVGSTFSTINRDVMLTTIPDTLPISPDMTMPALPDFPTLSPDMTLPAIPDFPDGVTDPIPTGGRGNDVERASAWSYVIVSAAFDGCTFSDPKASDFSITVKEEPNSDGVWVEEWTATCDGDTQKTYTVTFTPGAGGNTEIEVK